MDRCRCEEYAAAVKKIKFYTVGTHRPDIIDNYDRSNYVTAWVKMGISLVDRRFKKPRAWKRLPPGAQPEGHMSEDREKREYMTCPYRTRREIEVFDIEENS